MLKELQQLRLRNLKLAKYQRQREPRHGKIFKQDSKHLSKLPRISSKKKKDKVTINLETQKMKMTNDQTNDLLLKRLFLKKMILMIKSN